MLAGLALSLPMVSSCTKEFLDPPVIDFVTEDHRNELASDPEVLNNLVDANLAASYSVLQDYWSSHDDFGLKAFQLGMDMLGEDIAYYGGWFQYDYLHDNFEANYRRTNSTWNQFYEVIANSNLILRDYFSDADENDAEVRAGKAKPLILRGISLYYLVNFYQANYQIDPEALGVPIPLKPEDEMLPRAKVSEVYAQIIEDLTYGVENGVITKAVRTDVDQSVSAAYLAKAYADMGDWVNVEKYAKIAKLGGSDIVTKYSYEWSVTSGDVLWGFDVTPVTSTSWASFYAHMDPTIAFYAGKSGQRKYIYNWLFDQMGKNDVRRTLFVNEDYMDIAEENGFHFKDKNGYLEEEWLSLKFKTKEAANTDYIFLRVQDPILLEIEAINEQGRTAEAAEMLNDFIKKRDKDFDALARTDEDADKSDQELLREKIRLQRRIELWGEGTSYFDFKRWGQIVDRTKVLFEDEKGNVQTTSNHGSYAGGDLNNLDKIHLIPQREINNNKLLVQNKRPKDE